MSYDPYKDKKLIKGLISRADKLHSKEPAYVRLILIELVYLVVLAVLMALTIHTFLFQIIRVDGPSMEPTFFTGERVICQKLPFKARAPVRGEVLICEYNFNGVRRKTPVIKRVVGLPGETVSIKNGKIYIDSFELNEKAYWKGTINRDMAPYTVPINSVFMVGDNRNYSSDSRDPMIGAVPFDNIIGKVSFVIWPLDVFGKESMHLPTIP